MSWHNVFAHHVQTYKTGNRSAKTTTILRFNLKFDQNANNLPFSAYNHALMKIWYLITYDGFEGHFNVVKFQNKNPQIQTQKIPALGYIGQ